MAHPLTWDEANEKLKILFPKSRERGRIRAKLLDLEESKRVAYFQDDDEAVKESLAWFAGTSSSAAVIMDRSYQYVQHLLPGPPPALPNSRADLDASLQSSHTQIKLPVTPECYAKIHMSNASLAQTCLIATDGSHLSAALSTYIQKDAARSTTELDVTLTISPTLESIFSLLDEYSELGLNAKLTFNAAEADTSSRAVFVGKRPDTIGMANSCSFLPGEDKRRKLQDGIDDLRRKKMELSRMHYGEVHFILGYAAAEGRFRWLWLGADQEDVQDVGKELNVARIADRIELIQNMVFVYRLMAQMARAVPQLTGRQPVFEILERHTGAQVLILDDGVRKTINNFDSYCREFETSLEAIKIAYEAANEAADKAVAAGRKPFVVCSKESPCLNGRRKVFIVETTPLGFHKDPSNTEEVRALALACVETAQVLHDKGVVHRDFRLPNVVCLGPSTREDSEGADAKAGSSNETVAYMVIDLEAAAEEGAEMSANCRLALASRSGVLEDGRYTAASDMVEIGLLLRPILYKLQAHIGEAKAFVSALLRKELTAKQALDHPWLAGLRS